MKTKNDLDTIVLRKSNIDIVDIDGQKAMMDLEQGKYFILNDVASSIWDIISEPCSIKYIVTRLSNEYDVDDNICEKYTIEFIERLKDAKLIEVK